MGYKLTKNFQQWKGVLLIASSVSLGVILGNITGVFQFLEWASYDQFFRLRPPESVEDQIVIVTVDDDDINYLKDYPINDGIMAKILSNIQSQNPRAIGVDIYRDIPVNPGHEELINIFKKEPKIFGIQLMGGNGINPPPTLADLGQVGASDIIPDADSKIRRAFILAQNAEKKTQLSLGSQLALNYLEKENISLEIIDPKKKIYKLGKAIFKPLTGKEGEYVESNTGGYQIILNYRGGINKFTTISMQDVLNNKIPPNLMNDKLVFLGGIAPSLKDSFLTPYNSNLLINEAQMPGIVIHANLASQMIRGAKEGRLMLYPLSKKYNWIWISSWSFLSCFSCWILLEKRFSKGYHLYFFKTFLIIFSAGFLIIGISYLTFTNGWILPIFSPFLASICSAILITNYHNQWYLKQVNLKLKIVNSELENSNLKLENSNQQLENANQQLENYSHTLEEKVEARTAKLKQALDELKATQSHLIQTEKMAALGQMVAGVAHEINNPTNFIYGNVNPAKDYVNDLLELISAYQEFYPDPAPEIENLREDIDLDYLKEDFFKILDSIKRGAQRIKEIVESLKIFARLDESAIKKVDIHQGIDSTLMILNNRLNSENGLNIKIIKEYGELPKIQCYAGQMNQVFMNILTNSIDAIEEKQYQLNLNNQNDQNDQKYHPNLITITTKIKNENYVLITFLDNGMGIPEIVKAKIFDPFFTTKVVGKGSGLGLSTSHSIIVDQHNGKIHCNSTPEKGTEFTIELPIDLKVK